MKGPILTGDTLRIFRWNGLRVEIVSWPNGEFGGIILSPSGSWIAFEIPSEIDSPPAQDAFAERFTSSLIEKGTVAKC
jgi:hypothetical protein